MTKGMIAVVAGALALAGCAQGLLTPNDTARMPLNPQGGPVMTQDQVIGFSSWVLKNPGSSAGNPARAARALAAEDWLAGQSMLYGSFDNYAPVTELSWSQFRRQARAAIGLPADAHSQDVVNHLMAAADALDAGNTEAAKAQLAAPIFTLGPAGTLQALSNLPPLPASEWAFAELNRNDQRAFGCCGTPWVR